MNIQQAKQIPIEEMLGRFGFAPQRERTHELWYASPFRHEETPSFKVNRSANLWYDFAEGRGGDVIDLVQHIEQLPNVSATLARMDELIGSCEPPPTPKLQRPNTSQSPKLELVRLSPVKARSLKAYLKQRGIDPNVVEGHVREVHYRHGEKEYFALGIPNEAGSYELRNRFFKGTLGKKEISIIPGDPHHAMLFEGMFDYLTALQRAGGHLSETILILNSVALGERAATHLRRLSPERVDVYRDHDSSGEELFQLLSRQLPDLVLVDQAASYAGHRDLNGWHVAQGSANVLPMMHGRSTVDR